MPDDRYRVILAADDAIRSALRRALESSACFAVVEQVVDSEDVVAAVSRLDPDVVVIGLPFRELDGFELLRTIRRVAPSTTVVAVADPDRGEAPGTRPEVVTDQDVEAVGGRVLARVGSWDAFVDDLRCMLAVSDHVHSRDHRVRTARLKLPQVATSGRDARHFVRETLDTWGAGEVADDAELLTSELVTNAFVHAGSGADIRVALEPGRLRVQVVDTGGGLLHRRAVDVTDIGGRGLFLVDVISRSWGTSSDPDGKAVWFELDAPG